MRQAGTITDKQDATRLSDYLIAEGIPNKVEPVGEAWAIWIRDENQLERGREELARFQAEPHDPRYKEAASVAKQVRREAEKKQKQAQRNFHDMRNVRASPWRRTPVTMGLIVISVLVFLNVFEMLGLRDDYLYLSMTDDPSNALPEIRRGQLWRLITPIFMHATVWHLVFNMYWLYQFGTLVERVIGSWRLVALVLLTALVSDVLQFAMQGPFFLGMSGVVYGLFGYAWIRGQLDPTSGLWLRPDVVFIMLAVFALCITGVIGNVANWAHGGGLASGAALGYLAFTIQQMRRRR